LDLRDIRRSNDTRHQSLPLWPFIRCALASRPRDYFTLAIPGRSTECYHAGTLDFDPTFKLNQIADSRFEVNGGFQTPILFTAMFKPQCSRAGVNRLVL
jgi:hypothetical protein